MNRQTLIAILLAALAAMLTWYYLGEREAELKSDVTPVKVLVAKKPISRGSLLTEDKVSITEIPGAYVMPGAVSSATVKGVERQWEAVKNQFAVVPLAKGEQILPNKLSKILPGFAGVVPEGMRIVALSLDPASAVGGHVKPGNRVDVLGTFDHEYRGVKRTSTVVLAQNVLVTAVGEETTADRAKEKSLGNAGGGGAPTLCLAVSPEDALRLSLSEREGALKLALRSMGDENLLDLPDQNLGSVLGPLLRVQKDEIKSAPKRIEIIRGMQ
jgi:pilus assembly protein CpaB